MPTAIKLTKNDWIKLFIVLLMESVLAFTCFIIGPPIAYIGLAAVILGFIQFIVMAFIAVNMLIQLDKSGRANMAAGIAVNAFFLVQSANLSIDAIRTHSYPFVFFGVVCAMFFGTFLVMRIGALVVKLRKNNGTPHDKN